MSWTLTNLSLTREDPLKRIRCSPLSRVGRVVVGPLRISPGRSATISDAVYQKFERRIQEYRGAGLLRVVQTAVPAAPSEETDTADPTEETDNDLPTEETEPETAPEETPADEAPAAQPVVPVEDAAVKLPGEDEEEGEEEKEAKPRRKTRAPKVAA